MARISMMVCDICKKDENNTEGIAGVEVKVKFNSARGLYMGNADMCTACQNLFLDLIKKEGIK